jgi:hypothetical protein
MTQIDEIAKAAYRRRQIWARASSPLPRSLARGAARLVRHATGRHTQLRRSLDLGYRNLNFSDVGVVILAHRVFVILKLGVDDVPT